MKSPSFLLFIIQVMAQAYQSTITALVAALAGCSSGESSTQQPAPSAQAGGQNQTAASSASYAGQNQLAARPESEASQAGAPRSSLADSALGKRLPPMSTPAPTHSPAATSRMARCHPQKPSAQKNSSTISLRATLSRSSSTLRPGQETFGIQVDGGPSPFGPGYHLVRIGIKGKEIATENRKPAHLVFVIDVSGSMNRENRLELVKRSVRILIDQLQPADTVGIVVYGTRGRVVLDPTSAEDKRAILSAIDSLTPEGSTNAEEGLLLGYEMADRSFERGAINRVILCSDGVANVGETRAGGILRSIEDYARKEINLSTFGFGMGNYNDVLMEQLADKGEGQYAACLLSRPARLSLTGCAGAI